MQKIIKNAMKAGTVLLLIQGLSSSCKKDNTVFDTYFYLSHNTDESTAKIQIDGKDYGTINYVAAPVSDSSSGLNHIKLPAGRHNILVLDNKNKEIISCYIEMGDGTMGDGSWGFAGGGEDASSNKTNEIMVGLYE